MDFRLLTDERDLVRMRDGVRRLFDLARHKVIAPITADPYIVFTIASMWLPYLIPCYGAISGDVSVSIACDGRGSTCPGHRMFSET